MMTSSKFTLSPKWGWFAAFAASFAVLAAFVFWGTWSPDVSPVMPDDTVCHPLDFSRQFTDWYNGWLASGVFAPFDALWSGVIVSKYWTQEFKYASALFISGLGLACFLRARGLSRPAAYGAGLLLGFCGYWTTLFSAGHAGWFYVMASMIPAFYFLDRAVVGGMMRHWVLLGACVGWGSSRQPDLFLLFAVLLAVYFVYACCRERKLPWKGTLIALALFGIVGGPGIRAAFVDALSSRDKQIADSMGTSLVGGKGSADAKKSGKEAAAARWVFATNWSMPPEDTLEFFIPRIHGDTSCPMTLQLGRAAGRDVQPYTGRLGRPLGAPRGNYRQHSLYVGFVTCLLALFGLGRCIVRSKNSGFALRGDAIFFGAVALACWLFSMGRFCEPIYRLVYALPFGDYLRAPVKWHHLTEFCICLLAGYGVEAMIGFLKSKGVRGIAAIAISSAVVLVGAADLARIDRLFCAPIDLRIVRGRNAAADDVLRRGKGMVCDLVEGANGLIAWSFGAHGVGMTKELAAADIRFVWVLADQIKSNRQLAAWLKAKATPVGNYLLTQDGIRATAPERANAALYQVNGVPPSTEPARPPISYLILALGIASVIGTLAALGCLVREVSVGQTSGEQLG